MGAGVEAAVEALPVADEQTARAEHVAQAGPGGQMLSWMALTIRSVSAVQSHARDGRARCMVLKMSARSHAVMQMIDAVCGRGNHSADPNPNIGD